MLPPRRVRTNRIGSPYRSPTPNRHENDPFRQTRTPPMSPETMKRKANQKLLEKQQQNAIKRAKMYAKKFKNFQNNTVNHVQTNDRNFQTKVRNINRPTFLLSDALNTKNGKVRHVYPREYLNKVFKNKTIHRGPHTGVPTDPSMMRNYRGVNNINKRHHEIYQRSKNAMIQVYGREGYFNTNLQTLHATDKLKPHHVKFTTMIQEFSRTFKKFIYDFLEVPTKIPVPDWYTLSEAEVQKFLAIMNVYVSKVDDILKRPMARKVFKDKIIQILYNKHGYPREINEIVKIYKEFFNQFKNLLNL